MQPPAKATTQLGAPLQQASPGLVTELKRYLTLHRDEVKARIAAGGVEAGYAAGVRYAKVYDGLLASLYHAARASLSQSAHWVECTLAAVGSYGRGALAYGSDVDVRFLVPTGQRADHVAEAILYPLWDAGVSVGHQVVTTEELLELCRTDLPTATALLDWRAVAGGPERSLALRAQALETVFADSNVPSLIEALVASAQERRQRYGDSVYLLEPELKLAAGGLRDLDTCHWVAKLRWNAGSPRELLRLGVLLPREVQLIEEATEFLWRVRQLLHGAAGRRADRLVFERQEPTAVALGYGAGGANIERFMSDYYRHARAVVLTLEQLVTRAAPPPRRRSNDVRIDGGLKLTQGAVSLEDSAQLEAEPVLALRLVEQAVLRELPVYGYARDAIARACASPSFCQRLREDRGAADLFQRLVAVAQRTQLKSGSVVAELHDVGLLLAMVPEFSPVVGRVHHDIYHVYTVDVHSVAAVDRLAQLCRGELAAEYPLASRLAAEMARPPVVFFACLLHDIGKDIGGRHHAERGQELARVILARLGVEPAMSALVQQLVRQHLRMYHTATRRDLDDPRTLDEFCQVIRDRETLRELYLLTVADVSTTSPTAMTDWKARLLEELYWAADARLASGSSARGASSVEQRRRLIRGRSRSEYVAAFLEAVPERYLFAYAPEVIRRHAQLARRVRGRASAVELLAVDGAHGLIAFVADDRTGLLAKATAVLAAARLSVLSAEILSFKEPDGQGRALDLFWVQLPDGAPVDALIQRLEHDFSALVQGAGDAGALVAARRGGGRSPLRPSPPVATELTIDNRASLAHTVMEVITRDRPALLFTLATALQTAGVSVARARINTEGSRVADVFYITDAHGGQLDTPERIEALKHTVFAALSTLDDSERGAPSSPAGAPVTDAPPCSSTPPQPP